jgi:hypothetical protein
MNPEHKKIVIELSDYLLESFKKKAIDFFVDDTNVGEQYSILVSGFMSALANTLHNAALITEDEAVIKETDIYIKKLFKSVPDSNCEIVDMTKH